MSIVMEKMPVYITQKGRRVRVDTGRHPAGDRAAFVNAPHRRDVVSIVVGRMSVDVTVEGVMNAVTRRWVEPFGGVTMWTDWDVRDRQWFVVDLDGADRPDVLMQFPAGRVVDVLAAITVAACTEPAGRFGGAA